MANVLRRALVAAAGMALIGPTQVLAHSISAWPTERGAWLEEALQSRGFNGPLVMGKFRDQYRWLAADLPWSPDDPDKVAEPHRAGTIVVPKGFVTDLASIPPPFTLLLPPDGAYAAAAVVHDYLYWTQVPDDRKAADDILHKAMTSLHISRLQLAAIYEGVRLVGESAWTKNRKNREAGEKRVLIKTPSDPGIAWSEWKKQEGVFGAM